MVQEPSKVEQIFAGNSKMAMLIRAQDWSPTPLGCISSWASSLKTTVSIRLNSRFPMVIWRGKELVMLYNDAWRPLQGTKHPKALQQVRTLEQVQQVPVIALTAYAGELDRQQAIGAGFQKHLSKSVEPNELINVISALINSKGTAHLIRGSSYD